MIRIYAHTENEEESQKAYEAYLTSSIPEKGWIVIEGPRLFLLHERPPILQGEAFPVMDGPVDFLYTSISEEKGRAAYQAFLSGRRLPAGSGIAAGENMVIAFSPDEMEMDLGKMEIYHLPFDPLEEVLTPQEAAKIYHADAKRIQSDCERAYEGKLFRIDEVRPSGNTWLILKSAADRVYKQEESAGPFLNPLLLVFSTIEAAKIWNRDSGVVRSAAAGAGHAAARMQDGDRRKSGRTWLVTRDAMDRLFGQAMPQMMKISMKNIY